MTKQTQSAAITNAINEIKLGYDGNCVTYDLSDKIIVRGPQRFAVFGSIAYELLPFRTNACYGNPDDFSGSDEAFNVFEYHPVIIEGKIIGEFPDEGRSGLLYVCRCIIQRGELQAENNWYTSFIGSGWLRADELELTNDEIAENITNDILAGENVFYPKPAGWV